MKHTMNLNVTRKGKKIHSVINKNQDKESEVGKLLWFESNGGIEDFGDCWWLTLALCFIAIRTSLCEKRKKMGWGNDKNVPLDFSRLFQQIPFNRMNSRSASVYWRTETPLWSPGDTTWEFPRLAPSSSSAEIFVIFTWWRVGGDVSRLWMEPVPLEVFEFARILCKFSTET